MGRAIWMTVKFGAGLVIGALIGAVVSAYAAGTADSMGPTGTGESATDRLRSRLTAARAAGDAAAMQTEAALTQQFRNKVNDPDALNPPTALHP